MTIKHPGNWSCNWWNESWTSGKMRYVSVLRVSLRNLTVSNTWCQSTEKISRSEYLNVGRLLMRNPKSLIFCWFTRTPVGGFKGSGTPTPPVVVDEAAEARWPDDDTLVAVFGLDCKTGVGGTLGDALGFDCKMDEDAPDGATRDGPLKRSGSSGTTGTCGGSTTFPFLIFPSRTNRWKISMKRGSPNGHSISSCSSSLMSTVSATNESSE